MHHLRQVELDFQCYSSTMAQWFNEAAEQLFIAELLPVVQQVLDEFDFENTVRLDEIKVQLPPLHLPVDSYALQHDFREELRRQLWLLMPNTTSQANPTKQSGLTVDQQQQLLTALQQADSYTLEKHWPLYLQHPTQLLDMLKDLANRTSLCQTLAFGLTQTMLAQLLQLLAPADHRFMLQLMAQPQLFRAIPAGHNIKLQFQANILPLSVLQQRQKHLWQFSLSYLLVERGSQFNRRSYLHYLLRKMAAHDNLSVQSLVQHMLLTLHQSRQMFAHQSPLLLQLTELLTEMADTPWQQPALTVETSAALKPKVGLTVSQHQQLLSALRMADSNALLKDWPLYLEHSSELLSILRQLASQSDFCRVLAFGLNKVMLARMLDLLAPTEQRFMMQLMAQPHLFTAVQRRVKTLPQYTSQPLPPADLQRRQRHLWQLSLSYLLIERGSQFNRRSYAHYLVRKMAAHDNIPLAVLVHHMLHTLKLSRELFTSHSPLLLQLSELLEGLVDHTQAGMPLLAESADGFISYFSRRLTRPLTSLPKVRVNIPSKGAELRQQPHRWQLWRQLLLLGQLTLAQQRYFNILLKKLLQQNSALWLDGLRLQLQGSPLLQRLIQYASEDNLQRLFQQLQPASFAGLQPYTQLLQWSLDGVSLPLPLYRQIRWQPLLQCSLQRQPITLSLLLSQLQLWLEAESGNAASYQLLMQLAQQLVHYSGNTAHARRQQFLQQLNLQLAVTKPSIKARDNIAPVGLNAPCLNAPSHQPANTAEVNSLAPTTTMELKLQKILQTLLQALPIQHHQRAYGIAIPLLQHFSFYGQAANCSAQALTALQHRYSVLFALNLLLQWANTLASSSTQQFYQQLIQRFIQLHDSGEFNHSRQAYTLLLKQLSCLLQATLNEAKAAAPVKPAEPDTVRNQAIPASIAAGQQPHLDTSAASISLLQTVPVSIQEQAKVQLVLNAGIVLAAPYIPLLLQRLGWVSAQRFVSKEHAWQACVLLQYMVQGHWHSELTTDYWQQWQLNMLLCGVQVPCPSGFVPQLPQEVTAMADSLLVGILAQWTKLANSSITTLREFFLQRDGRLERAGSGNGWQLQLSNGPYDMLLDGLPWSYSLIRYPWMQGEIYVHWRG